MNLLGFVKCVTDEAGFGGLVSGTRVDDDVMGVKRSKMSSTPDDRTWHSIPFDNDDLTEMSCGTKQR